MKTSSSIKPALYDVKADTTMTDKTAENTVAAFWFRGAVTDSVPSDDRAGLRAPAERSGKNMADLHSEEFLQYDRLSLGRASERTDDELSYVSNKHSYPAKLTGAGSQMKK